MSTPRTFLSVSFGRFMTVGRAGLAGAALFGLAACGAADDSASPSAYSGDASFGTPVGRDGSVGDAGTSNDAGLVATDAAGNAVSVRVFHGVANLGAVYVCHDPDYQYDTEAKLAQPGPEAPNELKVAGDSGVFELGAVSSYVDVAPIVSGALTVHRAPEPPIGDGGMDASTINYGPDGGPSDGGIIRTDARCDPASQVAVLPLPTTPAWLDPLRTPQDAGSGDGGVEAPSGWATLVSGAQPLTLWGSGLVLESDAVAARRKEAENAYRLSNPGDEEGALAAGRAAVASTEATYGPRFLLTAPAAPKDDDTFSLYFSHLIPAVPASSNSDAGADAAAVRLHLCTTAGGVESIEPPMVAGRGLDVRSYTRIADNLSTTVAYRFRVFLQSDFELSGDTCATTTLKPVAELVVNANTLEGNRSYTLFAWGALFPDSICTAFKPGLIRPGCVKPADKLRPRLEIVAN